MVDPSVGTGVPGAGSPGSGVGAPGCPGPDVAELQAASNRQVVTAPLSLTLMTRSLEWADPGLLNDGDRQRLRRKGAGDLQGRLLLPGTSEIAAVGSHEVKTVAIAGALDAGRPIGCGLRTGE